jgi:hypothetical protein
MLAEGAASISGQVELPEDRRGGSIVVYAVPVEKDDVLRYFAAPVADDGSFALDHVPPGRYWTVAKPVAAESEMDTSKLRLPSEAATRAKLKREAEAAKVRRRTKALPEHAKSPASHHVELVTQRAMLSRDRFWLRDERVDSTRSRPPWRAAV